MPTSYFAATQVLRAVSGGAKSDSLYPALRRLGSEWLRRQGLAPLAWQRWRSSSDCPLAVALDLQTAWYAAVGDDELHRRELRQVLTIFNRNSLTTVAFKGAALAYTVYPDPACRAMDDLDFWVSAEQMDLVKAALESLGYQSQFKYTRPLSFMILSRNELPMYGTQPGQGLIELHWGVFPGEWLRRTALVSEADVWARMRPSVLVGQAAYVLDPADGLIQICVHFAISHNASQPWLRSLVDVTLLARHQPLDWEAVVQRARAWRLATATWLVLALAQDLCGLDEAAAAVKALAPSRLRQKLIGRFANAEALVEMRDLSKSRWRYVYLLLMVDRGRDAARLVLRTLWPEADWLQARYGRSDARTRLRHALNAARGII